MISLARGLRLGIMCSTRKRKRNINRRQQQQEEEEEDVNVNVNVVPPQILKNGDRVNLSKILFTKRRDFLITYKDRRRPVLAKHLQGKFIVLHYVPLLPWTDRLRLYVTSLAEVYHAIHPKAAFEVVFIGVKVDTPYSNPQQLVNSSPEELFEDKFSIMPWTAIPFYDIKSNKYIDARLGFPVSLYINAYRTASFVIDPAGVVLQCLADQLFFQYGAPGYPFSDEKLDSLESEDDEALRHPSITKLLTSPERNYVINKDEQKIPVQNLEDKVVALYFYEDFPTDTATEDILKAYEQVANKEKFEIVLVYVHDGFDTCGSASKESFWKSFSKIPGLALPFKDPRCRDLQRIFDYPKSFHLWEADPRLVIIGPRGKFVEPYALEILRIYGTKAYPFTRHRLAELEVEYIEKVKLNMLWDSKSYFKQEDGSKVRLSQLVGKRIILIMEQNDFCWVSKYPKFWRRLKAMYLRNKGTDDEFEVINITITDKYNKDKDVAAVPWLRHRPFSLKTKEHDILARLFRGRQGLLAFDPDGRVVRRTRNPTIERGNKKFPFYAGGLEKEALKQIVKRFEEEYRFW